MNQPKRIIFLSLAEVVEIHADQIRRYGGKDGVRDMNLLSSAVAMPYASFGGEFLHNDIYEMSAAYAFHISQNHPFIDGNKRAALASTLVFLEMNGISISDPEGKLYDAMILLGSGKLGKSEFAQILRNLKKKYA
jgi:death-on-curing protein